MKKVLVITYYWPPAGGGGVQRWLKFTQYLPEFGWQPVVFAPENADYPLRDETLIQQVPEDLEVIRQPIQEPRRLYARLVGRKALDRPESTDEVFFRPRRERSFKQNISLWVRGNLFIPDARVLWVRPSIRYLSSYLEHNRFDAVVTTGPPHSVHLIGRGLKRRFGIPWIADFRDPWTDIEFYDHLMLSRFADRMHRNLEHSVFTEADVIVDVSPYWETRFREAGAQTVVTITNGFDPRDFPSGQSPLARSFLLTHVGTLSLDRNPVSLWKSLQELCAAVPGFKAHLRVELLGKTDPAVLASASSFGLSDSVVDLGYVSHAEAVEKMQSAQVLLLLLNRAENNAPGRMTGKIFEYLAARRPILLIGPTDSDPATLMNETGTGTAVDFDDSDGLRETLRVWFSRFQSNDLNIDSATIDTYSRQNLTKKLASLLDQLHETANDSVEDGVVR